MRNNRAATWYVERLETVILGTDCDNDRDHPQLVSSYELQRRDLQAFALARLIELGGKGIRGKHTIKQLQQELPFPADEELDYVWATSPAAIRTPQGKTARYSVSTWVGNTIGPYFVLFLLLGLFAPKG